jgi:hypothetical protein
MKPHAEMNEGPQAFDRFKDAMKAIVAVKKTAVMPTKPTTTKTKKPTSPKA